MRHPILVPVLVSLIACSGAEHSEPWWHEVHRTGDEALDAAFSSDESTVTVLFRVGAREVHVGRISATSSTRALEDLGALTVDGLRDATVGPDFVDLAARPGTDEMWASLGGQVVQLKTGSNNGTLVTEATGIVTCCTRSSIAFLNRDTLVFGNDVGVWTFTISGTTLASPKVIVEGAAPFGNERQVGATDDQVWINGGGPVVAFKPDGTKLPFSGEKQAFPTPMAVSPAGTLWSNSSSPIGFCIVPRHPDGGAQRPENGKLDAMGCDNLDIPLDLPTFNFRRADLSRSGRKLLLVTGTSLVLAEEGQPPPASNDLEGVWCGVNGPSFSNTGGVLKTLKPASELDTAFGRITLSGGGTLRTVSLLEPANVIKENLVRTTYDYFMKRTGRWLVIRGPVTKEQANRQRGAGYLNRSGLFFKGADETCTSLAP